MNLPGNPPVIAIIGAVLDPLPVIDAGIIGGPPLSGSQDPSAGRISRVATRDTELAGTKIKEGDWVALCIPSANRDESVFDDPDGSVIPSSLRTTHSSGQCYRI
jgi:hypothetical protein